MRTTTKTIGALLCASLGSAALAEVRQPDATAEPPALFTEGDLRVAAVPGGGTDAQVLTEAIEAELAGASDDDRAAILGFFAERGDAPFWSVAGGREAEVLIAALEASGAHGLPATRYGIEALAAAQAAASDRPAALEALASQVYLRFARDLSGGVLIPSQVDDEINVTPRRPAAADMLARLADMPTEAALEAAAPASPGYRALMAEKQALEAIAAADGWGARVPTDRALREGDRGPDVAALRERLGRLGYGAAAGPAPELYGAVAPLLVDAAAFDAELAGHVRAFQADHGLLDDGVIGARTYAALNASVEDRMAQVVVNLERMRWLGDELGARHILVNIPDYTVTVFEEGEAVYHTRSVVGENRTRTPEFSDRMTYLVVNPTWYIPDSIAERVYLPKLRQNPHVLAEQNMRIFTRAGTELNPALVDFAAVGDTFPFRIRQNPSAANALGRVKFMFPNQFAIYLHDTPARELFDRDARAFSNGCVRLEDPFELAHYLLAPQLDDPEASFRAWVDAGSERYVTLEEPIAVHITYRTAWVEEDGTARYREDIYGRDAKVMDALRALGVTLEAAQG